jgi:hypothetical protein
MPGDVNRRTTSSGLTRSLERTKLLSVLMKSAALASSVGRDASTDG